MSVACDFHLICNTLQHGGSSKRIACHLHLISNTLQHAATYCNTLPHTATQGALKNASRVTFILSVTQCNTLQHIATCSDILQRKGSQKDIRHMPPLPDLQHTESHCNTLQHSQHRGSRKNIRHESP